MSNSSFGSNNQGQRSNHLQSESYVFAPPNQLAQFAAATAGGYVPQAYSQGNSFGPGFGYPPQAYSQSNAFMHGSGYPQPNTSSHMPPSMPVHQQPPMATPQHLSSNFAHDAYASAQKIQNAGPLQPPPSQPINDLSAFKGCKFITLDSLLIETRDIYDKISGTFQWEMCENQDGRCVKLCQDNADKRLFIISSGSLGRNAVPTIHSLPQVYAIYIYCSDVPANLAWSNQYNKVRVVCNDDDKYLLPQLAVDVAQTDIEWGDALHKASKRDDAVKKYNKALANLERYPHKVDEKMVGRVKSKLAECK